MRFVAEWLQLRAANSNCLQSCGGGADGWEVILALDTMYWIQIINDSCRGVQTG